MKLNLIFADSVLQGWLLKACRITRGENWAWLSIILSLGLLPYSYVKKIYLPSMDLISNSETHAMHNRFLWWFLSFDSAEMLHFFSFSVTCYALICSVIFVCLFSSHCSSGPASWFVVYFFLYLLSCYQYTLLSDACLKEIDGRWHWCHSR